MSDTSKATRDEPSTVVTTDVRKLVDRLPDLLMSKPEIDDVIQVVEERMMVARRRRATGSVKVGTRTETVEAVAEADLDRYCVEVTRVPVGRITDEAPRGAGRRRHHHHPSDRGTFRCGEAAVPRRGSPHPARAAA